MLDINVCDWKAGFVLGLCLYDLLEGKWTVSLRLKANGLFYCDSLKANRPFYCDSHEGKWTVSLDCLVVFCVGLLGWTVLLGLT